MKYYVVQKRFDSSGRLTHTLFKRYKCIDGFTPNKSLCWRFSKQGATRIVANLTHEYRKAVEQGRIKFDMIPAEED